MVVRLRSMPLERELVPVLAPEWVPAWAGAGEKPATSKVFEKTKRKNRTDQDARV